MSVHEKLRDAKTNIDAADECEPDAETQRRVGYLTSAVECLLEAVTELTQALQRSASDLSDAM